MIPDFDENGNLPPGIYFCNWNEFKKRFGHHWYKFIRVGLIIKNEHQYQLNLGWKSFNKQLLICIRMKRKTKKSGCLAVNY
jgi:hypothetical protein